jgi:cell division transport system ATP-binding protein
MIKFYHVHKSYGGGSFALFDINLTIQDGEFLFLVGPSGAGKSTLLKLIYMEELPTDGVVTVGRFTSAGINRKKILELRRHVGVVFQDFRLLRDRDLVENVAFALRITGDVAEAEIRERATAAINDVGLYHRRHALPRELSGGEQQRVAIARAVVNKPFVLVADEPTGNLDPQTSDEITALLRRMNAHGTSVLFATHKMEMVDRSTERYLRMEGGQLVEDWVGSGRGAQA